MKLKQNDWDILFTTQDYTLGITTIKLAPLSLQNLPNVINEFVKIKNTIIDNEITIENYVSKLAKLSTIVATKAPSLISIMSGLHVDDIKRLPITVAISLLTACIEVNTKDQENFLKNLMALADKIGTMTAMSETISVN